MNKKHNQPLCAVILFSLVFCAIAPLSAEMAKEITFTGGYTKAVMKEGRQSIILSQGAAVHVGSILFEADTIELSGKDSRYLAGSGNVRITDSERGLSITSSTISYDRENEQIIIDGWVEIQDLRNEVIASGAYLAYGQDIGMMKLQIAAKLLHHTESGPMVCRADSIEYDRVNQRLALYGNSSIYWKGDIYEASMTTVDLETEEILMEGTIKGTVHG